MNEKQLQEIEACQNELPPGEKWEAREGKLISTVNGKEVLIIDVDASPIEFEISKADLAFMACAHEKLPALLAEVRRLRAVVEVYADHDNWNSDGNNPANTIWYGMVEGESGYARAEECLREDGEG